MPKVIVISGASSGFGALTARALSRPGHRVYAGMRETTSRNAPQAEAARSFAEEHGADLRPIEMDVASQSSVDAAIARIGEENQTLDVVIHNAGHMGFGPSESFTPEQLAELYDTNVISTQRVNRAVLPRMRAQGTGLVIWVSSSSTRGGTPPYLGPYFAAKAAMDALAVSYAGELTLWGIDSSIIVPGVFTSGTNHFKHAGVPGDRQRAALYEAGPYSGMDQRIQQGLSACVPADADVKAVVEAIVEVVAMAHGKRPFRVHIDPAQDGAEVVNAVADHIRNEFLRRIGLAEVLSTVVETSRRRLGALDGAFL